LGVMTREAVTPNIASSAQTLTVPYTIGSSADQVEDIVTAKIEGVGYYDMVGRNPVAVLGSCFHWPNITASCMQIGTFSCINGAEDVCSKVGASFCSTVCPDAFSAFASELCCMQPCTQDRSAMLERSSCWVPVCAKGAVACLCCVSVKGMSSVVSYTLGAGLDENLFHPVYQSYAPPLQDMDAWQTLKISHDLGALTVDQKTVLMAGRGIRLNFPELPARSSVAPAPLVAIQRRGRVLSLDSNELKTERKTEVEHQHRYDVPPVAVLASPVSVLQPLGFTPGQVNMDDDFNGTDLMESRTPSRRPSISDMIVPSPLAASVNVPRLPQIREFGSTFIQAYIPDNTDAVAHTTRFQVPSSEGRHKGLVSSPSSSAYSSSASAFSLSHGSRRSRSHGMLFASRRPSIAMGAPQPQLADDHEDRSTLQGYGLGLTTST
jgi:hypothetical protein